MATRPIRYELHIRPLLRLIDRDNMAWRFDLWDYNQVKANADIILLRTAADMPPLPYGGPWPAEWVALFQRWKDEGFLRLDLGTVDATGYTATRAGDAVTLTGRGRTPSGGYRAWLEGILPEGRPREYVLYWEPPVPALPANPTLFRARTTFPAPAAMTSVTVTDAAGRHDVPIVAAPSPITFVGSLVPVQPALERIGATHLGTTPMIGGSMSRFRLGTAEFEVFSDGHSVDVVVPTELRDPVWQGIAPLAKAGRKQ